jgi:hypothetical protein
MEERLDEIRGIIESNPNEFYTGHVTMFFNDNLWNDVRDHLETTQSIYDSDFNEEQN